MKNMTKAAILICSFFFAAVVIPIVVNPIIYVIMLALLPAIEENVKIACYKLVFFTTGPSIKICTLFVALETIIKTYIHIYIGSSKLESVSEAFFILSPSVFHFANCLLALALQKNGIKPPYILWICTLVHYTFNIYRGLLPNSWHPVMYIDTIILGIIAAFIYIKYVAVDQQIGAEGNKQF